MSSEKPSIPKGTRDFSPIEMMRRNHIFDTIRSVFGKYGYLPIETPAMELLPTLLGKYGDEGDKLLFRILNSGNFLEKIPQPLSDAADPGVVARSISEKGLRYDLTVPFARFVAQRRNELIFPFKRYQIQPVWRADRPQKSRYREFYQCDVDVIGSDSLTCEVELIQIISEVFSSLGIGIKILLNNRKILAGIAEAIGEPDRLTDLTIAIDKLEKTSLTEVTGELEQKGFSASSIRNLIPLLKLSGDFHEKDRILDTMLASSSIGKRGLEEMRSLNRYLHQLGLGPVVEFDLRLARGLNYYTGTIIEVKSSGVAIGSICGGGRYDDLAGIFGFKGMSGVGVSFGADRIYDVMNELNLFPPGLSASVRLLFINFGGAEEMQSLLFLASARQAGIPSEIYPDPAKLKKQLDYADRRKIPYVAIIGKDELESGRVTLKDMETGEQVKVSREELIKRVNA